MTILERCQAANLVLRRQKAAIETTLPRVINTSIVAANGDAAKARTVACDLGLAAGLLHTRPWEVGMVTEPGDLVMSPDGKFTYIYSGAAKMTHANPTYFPGAAGVYYWSIIPEIINGFKCYPSITGIVVSVRKDEPWWNQSKTHLFYWKGADNPSCSWPPIEGNEWGVYIPVIGE